MVSWTERENTTRTDALFRNCIAENANIEIAQLLPYRLIFMSS